MHSLSFIYNLMISPSYRVWRHSLFVFGIFIVALNNLLMLYELDAAFSVTNFILILILIIMSLYLSGGYSTLYYLVPRFLLKKKYIWFGLGLVGMTVLLNLILYSLEYILYFIDPNVRLSAQSVLNPDNSFMVDVVFNSSQLSVCYMGIASFVLLKQWLKEDRNVAQLKKELLRSEVEQLKEQISPQILFGILNNAARQAKEKPEEVSAILVKLSEVLRYQLYDCSREKVLLKSEIAFIHNYLTLLRMNDKVFTYEVRIKGDANFLFVPPLLFSSLLQVVVGEIKDSSSGLIIDFELSGDKVCLSCECNTANSDDNGLEKIRERLNILYGDNYLLSSKEIRVTMVIPV